RMLSEWREMF
ncbi:antirepressor protein ant, partial [Escherichia coli EC1868]